MRSGNAVSFHIGLVPSEALYDKRGGVGSALADCEKGEFD